jgi:hypothetical protein
MSYVLAPVMVSFGPRLCLQLSVRLEDAAKLETREEVWRDWGGSWGPVFELELNYRRLLHTFSMGQKQVSPTSLRKSRPLRGSSELRALPSRVECGVDGKTLRPSPTSWVLGQVVPYIPEVRADLLKIGMPH